MMCAGAAAWKTPSSFLKAYFGPRVTMSRNFAATTSRRSEMSSPIRIFCLPACSGNSSGSITTSTRSRCGAKPLRGRAFGSRSDGSRERPSHLTRSCRPHRSDHPLQVCFVDICASPDNDVADDNLDHRTCANQPGFCLNSRVLREGSLSVTSITTPTK